MKEDLQEIVEIEEGIAVSLDGTVLNIKGPVGELSKNFEHPKITIKIEDNKIIFETINATRREKNMLKTFVAHVKNLLKGVKDKFLYKLKICSSHFPMNVSLSGKNLVIKNFLGEKCPRNLKIKEGVDVKINGDLIEVSSCSKDFAGNVASDIELLTKKVGKDVRIFQDGIYIIEKGGKAV